MMETLRRAFQRGIGKGPSRKEHDDDDTQDQEVAFLRARVRELETKLAENDRGGGGDEPSIMAEDTMARSLRNLNASMESSVISSQEDYEDASYYARKGIFVKPGGQRRCRWRKTKEGKKELCAGGGARVRENTEEKVDAYALASPRLGRAMALCRSLTLDEGSLGPIASRFKDSGIPHVTLDAISRSYAGTAPTSAFILVQNEQSSARGLEKEDLVSNWESFTSRVVYGNDACYDMWRLKRGDLKGHNEFWKTLLSVHHIKKVYKALQQTLFEHGDVTPKRFMYHFVDAPKEVWHMYQLMDLKGKISIRIVQITPVLLRCSDGVTRFGYIREENAPVKYKGEVEHVMARTYSCWKYTGNALALFSPCGAMMQQNPEASALFGMDSAENSVYVDFDKKGEKPVDRLKLLFAGANEDLYDEMWESVMEKGEPWVTKMRLWPHNLRPEAAMVGDSSVSSSMWSSTSSREEEAMFGKARWFYVSVNKFNDPADGSVLMFLEMKDITEIEEAKIKYVEQRKQEHALLSSIIPEHIIQVLVEENREMQNSARSSSKSSKSMSSSSGELLDLSAMRMDTENRVRAVAESHEKVTVFFADIVGFTRISSNASPGDVMFMLNSLFTLLDDLCETHGVYKVETIGDAYMCVAGLQLKSELRRLSELGGMPNECGGMACPKWHASRMVAFSRGVLESCAGVQAAGEDKNVTMRIGLHSGDVMSGVVGRKMPRFCLFGDTVNVASRMESTGRSGRVHASPATAALTDQLEWEPTGGVEVKGKGAMETFLLR